MGEPLGQLKVTVVRGKRLVIRDFKSSDPYVVLKLGNQTAKTKVISSCLNPVWNEELTLSLSEPVGVLHIVSSDPLRLHCITALALPIKRSSRPTFSDIQEVFDKDRFKADDKMGHAQVNLQPIVSAARLRQILKLSSGETTLRKVAPDSENCLVRESSITFVNGEVVQDVYLRLCEVESGEVELKLKFIGASAGGMR
ncbi:protein C2-DOMAIN ABA-RELATED 11 isoform X2 [Punica granatum]|nr:protein C2-DOMAIN ABA-RELATED 11 isoform X2 [Punica granatum]XP_031395397.1 protein C2-DOMAIN ABA-RELATED 11 isoform X2 [Punica granatum]XP_031395398.1 protein C2-DOMAIN ABA-RELATED 11 isoform X2 [Punica granatum]XP_031395399.1 protein C2-DOMAIN ABA-RELATED 11 isoform X2 [Punica granatum]